jgi:hypothetical protein
LGNKLFTLQRRRRAGRRGRFQSQNAHVTYNCRERHEFPCSARAAALDRAIAGF